MCPYEYYLDSLGGGTLGKNITGGDTVLYDGNKTYNVGNRIHIIKHSHGRMIFGLFERVFHEGTQ